MLPQHAPTLHHRLHPVHPAWVPCVTLRTTAAPKPPHPHPLQVIVGANKENYNINGGNNPPQWPELNSLSSWPNARTTYASYIYPGTSEPCRASREGWNLPLRPHTRCQLPGQAPSHTCRPGPPCLPGQQPVQSVHTAGHTLLRPAVAAAAGP